MANSWSYWLTAEQWVRPHRTHLRWPTSWTWCIGMSVAYRRRYIRKLHEHIDWALITSSLCGEWRDRGERERDVSSTFTKWCETFCSSIENKWQFLLFIFQNTHFLTLEVCLEKLWSFNIKIQDQNDWPL